MNKTLRQMIMYDYYRNTGGKKVTPISHFINPNLRCLKFFRCAQYHRENGKNPLILKYYRFRLLLHSHRYFTHLPWNATIGKGLYIGHIGRVIISSYGSIGDNVNIAVGVTIGQTQRGDKKGFPTIGNCVWIGINAVVVGNIRIGDDVLIAPNAYVNFDVPDHSIVIGNPGVIIHKENATEGYINNKV